MRCVDVLREIKQQAGAGMVKLEVRDDGEEITVWLEGEVYPFTVEDPEWDTPETLVSEIVDVIERGE